MTGPLRGSDPVRIGRYRLMGRLGAGGMGVVYLGRSGGGRNVAIKVIRAQYADNADFRERFRREVAISRQVAARWVLPVVDADTEAESPWLATAYVPGPSLHEAVAAYGPLPEADVRFLGAMLAEALVQVHGAGLVHRDLKPSNVLLALDGPRLIDFGIARALDETGLTASDVIVGSPGYLSPEQVLGPRAGPPSDVFSLGAVLAFALSGQRPFGEGTAEGMMYRTVHEQPDLAGVPATWAPLLEECLAKDPAGRPSAARLRAALTHQHLPASENWLPPQVTRLIAERSSALLDLDNAATLAPPYPAADAHRQPTETGPVPLKSPPPSPAAKGSVPVKELLKRTKQRLRRQDKTSEQVPLPRPEAGFVLEPNAAGKDQPSPARGRTPRLRTASAVVLVAAALAVWMSLPPLQGKKETPASTAPTGRTPEGTAPTGDSTPPDARPTGRTPTVSASDATGDKDTPRPFRPGTHEAETTASSGKTWSTPDGTVSITVPGASTTDDVQVFVTTPSTSCPETDLAIGEALVIPEASGTSWTRVIPLRAWTKDFPTEPDQFPDIYVKLRVDQGTGPAPQGKRCAR